MACIKALTFCHDLEQALRIGLVAGQKGGLTIIRFASGHRSGTCRGCRSAKASGCCFLVQLPASAFLQVLLQHLSGNDSILQELLLLVLFSGHGGLAVVSVSTVRG